MSDENRPHNENNETNDVIVYYIIGGVVLVIAIVGFLLFKQKPVAVAEIQNNTKPVNTGKLIHTQTPTPGLITKFTCEKQYYNPMVGFPKYYLSAEGTDTINKGDVSCEFTVTVKDKVVASKKVKAKLTEDLKGSGYIFRCLTPAIELASKIPTDVSVKMVNSEGEKADCKQNFIF